MKKEKNDRNVAPCATIRTSKGVQGKIYANPVKESDIPLFKATFERRYINKNQEWKSLSSYAEDEVLVLAATALKTWARMCELRQAARQESASQEGDEESPAEPAEAEQE